MKIRFVASPKSAAQASVQEFISAYGQVPLAEADYIVAVGGDGTALHGLQVALATAQQPVFAMCLEGSVGALANVYSVADLPRRLVNARHVFVRPLRAEAICRDGEVQTVFAINEIVFSRQRLQAAKIRVVSAVRQYPLLIADGVMIASAIGSGGYNHSAGGACLPYDASSIALTAIALHNSSQWRNTVVDDKMGIEIEVVDPDFRPVRLETNTSELRDVRRARVTCYPDARLRLLFDPTDYDRWTV